MSQLDWYLRAQLKPRQLHLLVALDDLRHLGRAAASLHVSQPAVSLALGELEKGLGLRLFERGPRGVQPNAYGECLIRQARAILGCLGQARDDLQALQSGAAGKIAVGALPATTPGLLPRALRALKRQTPGTRVLVREGAMEALLPELHRGTLDLIVGRLTASGDAIGQETLHAGHNVVVAGPDHPLARRRRLAWTQVGRYPWVLPPAGTLSRESFENALRRHGVGMPEDAIETLSIHVVAGYLQIAPALGLLAEPIARHYAEWGWLVRLPLELPQPPRPIGMTWSRLKAVTPALERFMQCLRDAAAEHPEDGAAPAPAAVARGPARRVSPRGD